MNIDPQLLSQLKSIDPCELSEKIDSIAKALGADPRYIKAMLGSPEDITKRLGSLSDKDIKALSERIDPSLLKKLNTGDMQNGK
ncbi:MAG: hypothetical protein IKT46_02575 [Clostridia bacterium]|nr:hypothetical protein [Clostridia bacterium]